MTLRTDAVLCPYCKRAYVETFDVDFSPLLFPERAVGEMKWACPSCQCDGMMLYEAAFTMLRLVDDHGDVAEDVALGPDGSAVVRMEVD